MYEFKSEDGKIYGPYEEEQILELVNCASMDGNSLVRKKTNEEWTPLNQIEELSHICRQASEKNSPPLDVSLLKKTYTTSYCEYLKG